jgi:hypothetical protein
VTEEVPPTIPVVDDPPEVFTAYETCKHAAATVVPAGPKTNE